MSDPEQVIEAPGNTGAKRVEPERVIRLGTQEPPNDPVLYNRRQADGSFRPLADFWERPPLDPPADTDQKTCRYCGRHPKKDEDDWTYSTICPQCVTDMKAWV